MQISFATMKKIIKVFYSQIFNAFFPIIILLILLKIKSNENVASIFLILNFANFYLLFTDYSSNIILIKESIQYGGISLQTHTKVIENINSYISVKFILLSFGFLVWIILCFVVPLLRENLVSNIFAYTFIIGYNLNFYWVYICSNKEYFYILSNFFARLALVLLLFLFVYFNLSIAWLMFIVGIINIGIALIYFNKFCKIFTIKYFFSIRNNQKGIAVLKRDYRLMLNNFLIMTPTNCLNFFVGYITNPASIIIYGFAEKIFYPLRSLFSVFINSVYPSFSNVQFNKKVKQKIYVGFYIVVIVGCGIIYFLKPFIVQFLKFNVTESEIFITSLNYFLLTLLVLAINTPLTIYAMVNDMLLNKKLSIYLTICSILIIVGFVVSLNSNNITKLPFVLIFSELSIIICLAIITLNKKKIFIS